MQHGIRATGSQLHIGVIDVRELTQIFGFDIGFRVVNGAGAALHRDHFTVQIFDIFDVVIIGVDHHQQAAFVVAVGEVDRFFTLVGNGDPRQRQIDIFGLQRRDNAAEVHWLQGVVELQLFGDSRPQVNVKTHILIALLKFERDERRIGGDNQGLIGGMGRNRKSQGQCSQ